MDSPLSDGLLAEGVGLIGSELNLDGLILAARERYKRMPFCVVEDWVILDAILTEDELAKVAAAGCQPMFLFAHKVVHDEQQRFEPGDWVRSTIARTFDDGYIFETRGDSFTTAGAVLEDTSAEFRRGGGCARSIQTRIWIQSLVEQCPAVAGRALAVRA